MLSASSLLCSAAVSEAAGPARWILASLISYLTIGGSIAAFSAALHGGFEQSGGLLALPSAVFSDFCRPLMFLEPARTSPLAIAARSAGEVIGGLGARG